MERKTTACFGYYKVGFLLGLLLPGVILAHDFYLLPDRFRVEPGMLSDRIPRIGLMLMVTMRVRMRMEITGAMRVAVGMD